MRRSFVVHTTAIAVGLGLALSSAASATWTKAGTGNGTGKAQALAAATSPSAATVFPTSSAIDIAFTPASNPVGTAYTVTRNKSKAGVVGATVACSGLTASPCHDTGLAVSTTFTYTITAVLQSWSTATGATANATTTSLSTPTVTSPTAAAPVVTAHNATNVSVTVTGTGFKSGLTAVRVAVDSVFTINSVTYVSSTQVTLNVSVSGGANKKDGFSLTNPDGGTVSCSGCLKNG